MNIRKKTMTGNFSELIAYVVLTALCSILFIGQTLIYLAHKFDEIVKPFIQNQTVQEYVLESTKDIWRELLIWPALVFMLLLVVRQSDNIG